MSRRTRTAIAGGCLLIIFAFAWFSKPESLKGKIERAGIRLTRLPDIPKGTYQISDGDRDKLADILRRSQQTFDEQRHNGVLIADYEWDVPFFYFWKREQRVFIDGIDKQVKFEPDI